MAPKAFEADDNEIVGDSGNETNKMVVNLCKNKKSRKLTRVLNIGAIKKLNFLTPIAKKVFNYLRLAFIKALIFQHFDLKSHNRIKNDASGYAIGKMSSQLNLDSNALLNDLNNSDLS